MGATPGGGIGVEKADVLAEHPGLSAIRPGVVEMVEQFIDTVESLAKQLEV